MPPPALYVVEPGSKRGEVLVRAVWSQDGNHPLGPGYRHIFPLTRDGAVHLVGVGGGNKTAATFRIEETGSWISPIDSHLEVTEEWDVVEPFTIGGINYVVAYASGAGTFAFIPISDRLYSQTPYVYTRKRGPGATAGFDVVNPIVVGGFVYCLCYSSGTGRVVIYSVRVTASSRSGLPALVAAPVWVHEWARKWTRFAFFEFGQESFFLKTNVGRLNVNIDHVLDDPADGTVEVSSYLHLEDALELDQVRSFYLGAGEPYFVTYRKDGKTTFNRFNGDCEGWTTERTLTTVSDAGLVVPFQVGDRCYVLFY